MSELGLGFEDRRNKRNRWKKKQQQQQQQRKIHARTADLENKEGFPSPNGRTSSSRSKVIGEILIQEEEEEYREETLIPENHSVSHSFTATGQDLMQEEEEDEEEDEETLGYTEKFQSPWINSDIHPLPINKQHFPRTASLDLNCHDPSILSPQFFVGGVGGLKKSLWTPNYQKGWSSERVPLPINGRQRYLCNGKALPSKWEDAERWIGSPLSVDGTGRALALPSYYRRPKSKSGPLGPHSPLVPCFDSGRVVNMASNSPLLAGVLVADGKCYGNVRGRDGGCGGGRFITANMESYIVQQSAAVHGWSDLSSQGTIQDEKLDSKEGSIVVSPKVLQKDMATQMSPTQMSPNESNHSSPNKSLSSIPPSSDPIVESESNILKVEIRDVQVDDQVNMTSRPKKHVASDRCLRNIIEWKNRTEDDKDSAWEVAESSKFLIKYNREEAKIRAWRNLQEAKAEAAIRKLEIKLEKERSSSMDKILNTLRSAQRKAEERRSAARAGQVQVTKKTSRRAAFFIRSGHLNFLSSCFTCNTS